MFIKDAIVTNPVSKAFKYQVFEEDLTRCSFSPFFILIADSFRFPMDYSLDPLKMKI